MEEDQNSEELEVTPHDHEATVVDDGSQVEDQEPQEESQESKQERNWREMRRKEQENQAKIKMQEELIQNLLKAQQAQPQNIQQKAPERDELDDIPEDEYLNKGQARKFFQKDARQLAREEFLRLEQEREKANFKQRLQAIYPDFDDIVNSETIAIFEQSKPKLAEAIAASEDPFKMGLQTYEYIKALNLTGEVDEKRHAKEVQKKIEKNEKTVQSPQAYNKRPMAQAFSLSNMSQEEKTRLYNEMMGFASQAGGGY